VPDEYSTIQSAIDATSDGDSVLVSAGTYYENINFNGKNISVIGENSETTTINGGQNGTVVKFSPSWYDTGIQVYGLLSKFKITGGHDNVYGGGIYCGESTSPTLTNLIISDNISNYGAGIYCFQSSPNINNVKVINNSASLSNYSRGGGIFCEGASPIINNSEITNNTAAYGGGFFLWMTSSPILSNVTIANNNANFQGGGICGDDYGFLQIANTIHYNNSPENIYSGETNLTITYSNIQGSWEGEGNIDTDPLFTDPDNENYSLQSNSSCIDTGNQNLWYADQDGSIADMGSTGGLFVQPNFISHNFGDVGAIMNQKQFSLYNFRETPITISSVNFGTASFTTDTSFPITIEPFETGIINIEANNTTLGFVEDAMEIESDDLPEGISVSLMVEGAEGNVLNGNLFGAYPVATYRISGDLTVADGDTAYLDAGTQFLFDGQYNFNIYGTLKAIGTESDSIIFDNYGDEKWRGFTLDNASDETEFEYVRISGAEKDDGGGMRLSWSNPTLTNVTTSNNTADDEGGGMRLFSSNPTFNNVTISNNTADDEGGGMYIWESNPILNNVTIENNMADVGGGMRLTWSNPTLNNVTISNNMADNDGGGMLLWYSNPTLTNVTISNNTANYYGGGMYLHYFSNPTLNNVTISNNTAEYGGGMRLFSSNPTLTNSIIWDNSPESIFIFDYYYYSEPIITYSDIQGGFEGEGNIDTDPLFTDSENGDYTLLPTSPCIDAGISYLELDGEVIIDLDESEYIGSAPDMGAYEFIFIDCFNSGDVNNDYQINVIDVLAVVCQILQYDDCDIYCNSDMDNNNSINVIDILIIIDIILN